MTQVTIYPAYSMTQAGSAGFTYDAPAATTANRIKRYAGCADSSWLYVRLPRHDDDPACPCYSCVHRKWWTRPGWIHRDTAYEPAWYRWVRWDIGAKNVRLKIRGGEHFVVVAPVDMPRFAGELAGRGEHGKLMALAYYVG